MARRLKWILAVVCLAAVAAGLWVWMAGRGKAPPPEPPKTVEVRAMSGQGKLPPWRRPDGSAPVRPRPEPRPEAPSPEIPELTAKEAEEIAAVIGNTGTSDIAAAGSLLTLLQDPAKSVALRMEAMTHVANLLPQEELGRLKPLVEDKATPLPILERILVEITNNPDEKLSLEMAVAVLESPHDAVRQQAHDLVAFLLDVDPDVDSKALADEARRQIAAGTFDAPPQEDAKGSVDPAAAPAVPVAPVAPADAAAPADPAAPAAGDGG